jgi:hypothetical protein
MKCKIDDCDGNEWAAGLCSKHYERQRRTGSVSDGPRARASLETRFWRQVAVGKSDECWPWTAKSRVTGYGTISLGGRGTKKELSHRVAWFLTYGALPEIAEHHGAVVRHKCANRLCCNPYHLTIGTQSDNVKDMWANKGAPRGNARLTEAQVDAIKADSRSSRVLAPIYGVSHAHIRSIRNGRTWKPKP